MPAPRPRMHGLTHVPGGSDPIPGPGASTNLADTILAAIGLQGFWKLNETSGTTAADSADSYNATPPSGYTAPTWNQPAGPPGEGTADFGGVTGRGLQNTSFPALSADLTLEVWAYLNTTPTAGWLIGQGKPTSAGESGVALLNSGTTLVVHIGHSSGPNAISSDTSLAINTWYHCVVTRAGGLWTLYLNGAAQSGTFSGAYTAHTDIWLGTNNLVSTFKCNARLSYAAAYSGALTAAEILQHYQAGVATAVGVGSVWYHSTGTPLSFLGGTGSYYLDTSTGDVWFKTAGAWAKIWDEP